ncbi:phosphoglycerate kinase [Candidatus Woesearchaeota archaeon]|jgi:3-phosphoglycerate kinase|nr:phosphoglycerate kinase [Candidatus Woesearchaeota archaeon]|tara:strand:- start:54910 stop:56115 length:1206 start_codon:yes stop_codon:yes gene_type:complete
MQNFLTLNDLNVEGKRVLVRAGFDIPLDEGGNIVDDKRIKAVISTMEYLLEKNSKIIVISHNGRPKGKIIAKLKMDKVAKRLGELLNTEVKKLDDCIGEEVKQFVGNMKPKDVVVLENLRFNEAEKEKDESKRLEFSKQLSDLGDIYVNEAFPNCHRNHASMTGIPKFLPSYVGFAVENEIKHMNKLLNPEKPFAAIIGGAKADKIGVIRSLLPKVDFLILGGVLADTFLKAKGTDIKASKFDEESLQYAGEFIGNKKLMLPADAVIADKFEKDAESKEVDFNEIPDGWMIMDIGSKTINTYKEKLKDAKTIVWAGPLGVFEFDKFANGTKQIAEFISSLNAATIIGGGDSAAAVEKFGFAEKMTHVSTGGGASLQFIEKEGRLPALVALEESYKKFKLQP